MKVSSFKEGLLPDLIILNGKVMTVDEDFTVAQALAIKGDRIVAVGSNEEMLGIKGPETEVLDVGGKTIMPGLIDSHIHMLSVGLNMSRVNCRTPPQMSISDIAKAVGQRAKELELGEWILGNGWDQVKLEEKRFPTRWDIDDSSPDNPVYLTRTCGHLVWVNSKALELAGITRDTPQQDGGTIVKDDDGEPTGLLLERPAFYPVQKLIPPPTFEDKVRAIKLASERFNEFGLTSVIEPGLFPDEIRAYQRALDEKGLTIRVNMMVRSPAKVETFEECAERINNFPCTTGFGNEMLKVGGIKISIDGGVGGRTALMREPYVNDPGNAGLLTVPEERLKALVAYSNRLGWQVGIHCAGGKATDITLDAFEAAHKEKSIKGKRFTIIHAYFPTKENFEQCRRMGVVVASQPSFLYYLGDSYYENVSHEQSEWLKPHRAWIDEGIMVASGTDSPVTPFMPFPCLWATIARKTEVKGRRLGTKQSVTREEAIRMYTINGAYLSFEEDLKGSLEPGKLADVIVLDRDILTCPEEEIKDAKVLRTILGGKTVYKA